MIVAWLRRNALAVTALPLVVGLVFVVVGGPLRDAWGATDAPDRRVGIGEAFVWNGATITLQTLERIDVPTDDDGEPFVPPPGTEVWRSRWRASDSDGSAPSCRVTLVDTDGRWFDHDPVELIPLGIDWQCTPRDEDDPSGYEFAIDFLTPTGTTPAALRFWAVLDDELVEVTLG